MTEPLRVLFVCTANICRSPAMELIAASMADPADLTFTSAGTHGRDGQPIDATMVTALPSQVHPDAVAAFRSRYLTTAMLTEADLVLTAEGTHRQRILEDHPQLHRTVFTLGQFEATINGTSGVEHVAGRDLVAAAGQRRSPASAAHDVADPYRRGTQAAEQATGRIGSMLSVVVPRLLGAR